PCAGPAGGLRPHAGPDGGRRGGDPGLDPARHPPARVAGGEGLTMRADLLDIHRGSHAHLLDRRDAATLAPVELDAVIVPTARPVNCLREAAGLARELKAPMAALCGRSGT